MGRLSCANLRMRTFSWENRTLSEGIGVRCSSQRNYYVPLGDSDSPGPSFIVTFHRENPPEVTGARVYDAFPYWVRPKSGSPFLVLARPHAIHEEDPTVLLRVSTWSPYTYGGRGFWRVERGETDTMLTGIRYYTDGNQRRAIASEALVKLAAGQTLRLRPEGSDDHWAVTNIGGQVLSELWEEFCARRVLTQRESSRDTAGL